MSSSLAEYGNVLKGQGEASDEVWIPLETFTGNRKDDATDYSGINATGTIFKVGLTDMFEKDLGTPEAPDLYLFNTVGLGQVYDASDHNGKAIPDKYKGTKLL